MLAGNATQHCLHHWLPLHAATRLPNPCPTSDTSQQCLHQSMHVCILTGLPPSAPAVTVASNACSQCHPALAASLCACVCCHTAAPPLLWLWHKPAMPIPEHACVYSHKPPPRCSSCDSCKQCLQSMPPSTACITVCLCMLSNSCIMESSCSVTASECSALLPVNRMTPYCLRKAPP